MPIVRWFDHDKLEKGMALPFGVPMRDLTKEEYDAFPDHVQRSIDVWPVFRKTNPNPVPLTPAATEDKEE